VPVVADASPLIIFARANHLDLLRDLFGEVWVPERVARKAFRDDPSRPGDAELAGIAGAWLFDIASNDVALVTSLMCEVDAGEATAIALAHERRLLLLIDDPAGRRAARARGVPVIGSAGAEGLARRRGLLATVRPTLEDLLTHGLRLSRGLYREILEDASEGASERMSG